MLIFTIDSNHRMGQPTTKSDMVGRLLRNNKAKIVKRCGQVILVQFFKRFNHKQTIKAKIKIEPESGEMYWVSKNNIKKLTNIQTEFENLSDLEKKQVMQWIEKLQK